MDCMDSPVEVVDLVYGNKPKTNLKSESFCYTPQSYLNHLQCNNNVSDMTWYVIILEIHFHIHLIPNWLMFGLGIDFLHLS